MLVPLAGKLVDGVDSGGADAVDVDAIMVLSIDEDLVDVGRRGNNFGMLNPDAGDGGFDGGCGLAVGVIDVTTFVDVARDAMIVPLLVVVDIAGGIVPNWLVVGVGVVMGLAGIG